jgi:hypothetical protein
MSKAMFAGVFLVVGWGSVEGNGIVHKTLFLLRDPNLTPVDHPLLKVRKSSIAKFIGIQWLFFAAIVAISETIGRFSCAPCRPPTLNKLFLFLAKLESDSLSLSPFSSPSATSGSPVSSLPKNSPSSTLPPPTLPPCSFHSVGLSNPSVGRRSGWIWKKRRVVRRMRAHRR